MAHQNEELLRKGYAAFGSGDMDAVNELFADDIVWHVPGNNMLSGDYEGKDAVFGFLGKVMEGTGGTLQQEIHDVLANDEHAVALVKTRAERGGKTLEGQDVHLYHVQDGKVTESWNHAGDQAAVDDFWS